MTWTVSEVPVSAGGVASTAFVLADAAGGARAEVWPSHGFNCLRWQTRLPSGAWGDLLYVAPDWDANPVPTRSGHPILFPFPNRMAGATFTHAGTAYELVKTESTKRHAIHGFTPRAAWRVVASGGGPASAFVEGEFRISLDAPAAAASWPADATILVRYTLSAGRLRVDANVHAADDEPLPFGLGYHGYFRVPTAAARTDASVYVVHAHASRMWELADGLPTGDRPPASGDTDFRGGKLLGGQILDHLFGPLGAYAADGDLCEIAALSAPPAAGRLSVWADAAFRELLLFTPVHRGAVAVEPYTCATNAMNLGAAGHDGGWLPLGPGVRHASAVEYRWAGA